MTVFNSLGSNCDFSYVLKSFLRGNSNDNKKLSSFLEERYDGKAILFYKGREALSFALKILVLQDGSQIAINGFT